LEEVRGEENELPNYHTGIHVDGFDELDIHFVYEKSNVQGAILLLSSQGYKPSPPFANNKCTSQSTQSPGPFIEVTAQPRPGPKRLPTTPHRHYQTLIFLLV